MRFVFKEPTQQRDWQTKTELLDGLGKVIEYDAGFQMVDPRKIIGLQMRGATTAQTLANDEKMKWLRKQVKIEGWNDPHPYHLNLYRLPSGMYTVASGGNHRSILANELGLPRITASVTFLISLTFVSQEQQNLLLDLQNQWIKEYHLGLETGTKAELDSRLKNIVTDIGWLPIQ